MRILFTGGGTGGHINPALAIAGYFREHHPDGVFAYVGMPNGMEANLVPRAGFDFIPMKAGGFQRQFNLRTIRSNARTLALLTTATHRAKKILNDFKPDAVVGTGGYVTGPLMRTAAKMGIPTITHDSNAYPGVTTKLLSKYVDCALLAFEDAKKYLDPRCKTVVTGNPVRQEFLYANREQAREKLGVGDKVCLLTFGGSNGAKRVNEAIADLIAWHYKEGKIHHIHATGKFGKDYLPELLRERGVDLSNSPQVDIREYIYDMPECMAAADLIIGRSGANTISELEAAGRASILIPSPNVAENHQYHNAMVLANDGAAVVIEEKDLTGDRLVQEVSRLIEHPDTLREYGRNASRHAVLDATERIYRAIMDDVYGSGAQKK